MSEKLSDRLRAVDHMSVEDCFLQSPLFAQAADALDAKDAEIERLKLELAASRLMRTHPHGEIGVGCKVEKVKGYRWPGEVVAVFQTTKAEWRYVVECTVPEVAGALHIYNGEQIARAAPVRAELERACPLPPRPRTRSRHDRAF